MMFRQIWLAKEDRDLQRIIWRYDSSEETKVYTLNTVTYGITCAPYLAMRCLKHLATQPEAATRKLAAEALLHDFYMDDVLTGGNTIQKAIDLRKELTELLQAAGFPLRKWRANDSGILQDITDDQEADSLLVLDDKEPMKTLGLLWNSNKDTLQYAVKLAVSNKTTKRSILSQIAKIYDPLGLIGPVVITAKIIMQELWKLNIGWDETVPQGLYNTWSDYYQSLQALSQVEIPRNFNAHNKYQSFTLHGFGDASEKAYGACVYCVYRTEQETKNSYLVCSKAKVAPLKTVSLPKLELNAALLVTRLVVAVIKALRRSIREVHFWSDSTIVLHWIDTAPHKLKTYYANRVTEIQSSISGAKWHYVPTAQNPADVISRGVTTKKLLSDELWWHGPRWLSSKEEWPKSNLHTSKSNTGLREETVLTVTTKQSDILRRYSSFERLKRVIAYCLRFKNILSKKRKMGTLTIEELQYAELVISRMIQEESFPAELRALKQENRVHKNSPAAALNPFTDSKGIIRVGGRLRHSELSYRQKYPILLPAKHHVTEIILRQKHEKLLHCGPQQLLASIREQY
ncbi:uncharacterized protein [Linepithema humile]|uniref:uncharacterized protein n=1 Tax=Linepithema humile TaxID=83485 RepID=UPI000623AF81|nr:PREDICTED: uncharacterized protein LOC105667540 [Linepithema humile]